MGRDSADEEQVSGSFVGSAHNNRATAFVNNSLSSASSSTLHNQTASGRRQHNTSTADEEQKMMSTNDLSAGEDQSYSKSNKTGDYQESYSDDEDAVYVPFEYQGDGRKREAKRHKMMAMVAKDEIEIDRMVRDYQNANIKIIESEQALEELRSLDISKKELQGKRNRLTAQLSRDR